MPENLKIVQVDCVHPQSSVIQTAGKILEQDGIVIFPAACMYGVAANALSDKAVKKVFQLKHRSKQKAILVLVPDRDALNDLVVSIPQPALKLMERFWPGKLTLVFQAKKKLPPALTAGTEKIGIRLPAHPVATALVKAAGFPITGTSANLSGKENAVSTDQLPKAIVDGTDLILDAGALKGGVGSTIVDVTTTPVTILREGLIRAGQIWETLSG